MDAEVEVTVMALRERLMEYFKGTCIARLTQADNIRFDNVNIPTNYQYQREQARNEDTKLVFIGSVPIMTLKRMPETVVFNTKTLGRSKQLRQVHAMLEEFFDTYLTGVRKETSDAYITT